MPLYAGFHCMSTIQYAHTFECAQSATGLKCQQKYKHNKHDITFN